MNDLPQYKTAEERKIAFEDCLISLYRFKVEGKHVCIPNLDKVLDIYCQAEKAAENA